MNKDDCRENGKWDRGETRMDRWIIEIFLDC